VFRLTSGLAYSLRFRFELGTATGLAIGFVYGIGLACKFAFGIGFRYFVFGIGFAYKFALGIVVPHLGLDLRSDSFLRLVCVPICV
jgi:hypothetical protein